MKRIGLATYYERGHVMLIQHGGWTITGKVQTLQHAVDHLGRFGFVKKRWKKIRPGVRQCEVRRHR